jgi:hypothetical protein
MNEHFKCQSHDNWCIGFDYPMFELKPFIPACCSHSTGQVAIEDRVRHVGRVPNINDIAQLTVYYIERRHVVDELVEW